ncbi:MAG: enoyl-CoA hydratase/isomerase family protein [Acidimicrobiales bacterium]|nr:enoyl-CoA hydratase/isomerase family protein [Acidimicrobiales bacterium]
MNYDDFESLKFSTPSDGVLLIKINKPETLNSVDLRGHRELSEIWRVVGKDQNTRVAVITGEGRAFSAGGDLGLIEDMTESYEAALNQYFDAGSIVNELLALDKPVISAINGVAVGAGLAVALLADISVIGQDVKFTDGHLRFGVTAGDHAVLAWPLLCGMAKAKFYLLTGDFIDGREAERIGLVSKCVENNSVLPVALEIAEKLAKGSALAQRFTKRALNDWFRQALPAFEHSMALEILTFLGPDAKSGLKGLKEKTSPQFDPIPPNGTMI